MATTHLYGIFPKRLANYWSDTAAVLGRHRQSHSKPSFAKRKKQANKKPTEPFDGDGQNTAVLSPRLQRT